MRNISTGRRPINVSINAVTLCYNVNMSDFARFFILILAKVLHPSEGSMTVPSGSYAKD